MKEKNPRTSRLLKLADGPHTVRLLAADRAFLRDLAKVQIISNELANQHHYSHLKGGSHRSLSRLESAGLLRSKTLRISGQPTVTVYEFANQAIARAWGGALPVTGAKRTDFHELVTSRVYFSLGRPEGFRVAARMTRDEVSMCGSCRPDAVYTDQESGELVLVEADSGHYSKKQIQHKMRLWKSLGLDRQVWGQPERAAARVPVDAGITVITV